jgi:hypothetical protein
MRAWLRRGTSLMSSPSNKKDLDGFPNAPSYDTLFSKVNPAVDGEDCDHDCADCTVHYPARFQVEQNDKLYGKVDGWATHLLVATGKTDWVKHVADEKGSVMEAIDRCGLEPSNGVRSRTFSSQ